MDLLALLQHLPCGQWPCLNEPEGQQVWTYHSICPCPHWIHSLDNSRPSFDRWLCKLSHLRHFYPAPRKYHFLIPIRSMPDQARQRWLCQSEAWSVLAKLTAIAIGCIFLSRQQHLDCAATSCVNEPNAAEYGYYTASIESSGCRRLKIGWRFILGLVNRARQRRTILDY